MVMRLSNGTERSRYCWLALVGVLALAAGLRLWGLLAGPPVWHADEFRFVFWPLNFFGGDLNPHFFNYPSLQFYLCAVVYLAYYLVHGLLANGWTLIEFAAHHYFWDADRLLLLARLTSVAFALGTVAWVFLLGRALGGWLGGILAALLLAVGALHVRQSPLAAVDVPMTFWFAGATWAAVRLLQRQGLRDYLLAGALVGLAAGTKYPGGLAGAGVLAAHLLARRSPFAGRLWLAGMASVGAFLLVCPYVLLDYETFWRGFSFETGHLSQGRADLGSGWWYHLSISLRYNLGWVGLGLTVAAVVQAVRRPRREVWVVLAGFVAYLAVMGWGKLVFARYALPLVALQAVLAADALSQANGRRWLLGLAALAALEPLYSAVRIAQLQGRRDTRAEARAWMERHVPAGAKCGNFGGWGGDVQVREIGDFWWRVKYFEGAFGRPALVESLEFLERQAPDVPFYQYAVQVGNRQLENGNLDLVHKRKCGYVVLHRHPLGYSRIDSQFAVELSEIGQRVASRMPEGLERSDPQYDPNDAYYIPVGSFGALRQPGPAIEIWRVDRYAPAARAPQTAPELFSEAYEIWAEIALRKGKLEEAHNLVLQGLRLKGDGFEPLLTLAEVLRRTGRFDEALEVHERISELYPDRPEGLHERGLLHADMGDHPTALETLAQALEAGELDSKLLSNMAISHMALENYPEAIERLREAVALDSAYVKAVYNLGTVYYMGGQFARAIRFLERTLELDPEHAKACNNLAWAHQKSGNLGAAVRLFGRAVEAAAADSQGTSEQRQRYQGNLARALVLDTEVRLAAGDTVAALKRLRRIASLEGGDAATFAQAGRLLFRLGDLDGSTRAYRQAVAADPQDMVARTNLGWNLYLQGEFDAAVAQYAAVLEGAPNSVALFNLGLAHVARGDARQAVETYARAVARFGADEGVKIGAVQDLRALAKSGQRAQLARQVLRAHWPEFIE